MDNFFNFQLIQYRFQISIFPELYTFVHSIETSFEKHSSSLFFPPFPQALENQIFQNSIIKERKDKNKQKNRGYSPGPCATDDTRERFLPCFEARGKETADNEITSRQSETRRGTQRGARKRDRSCSEARQEVGVRWNSAKVGEPGKGGSRPLRLRGSICKKKEKKQTSSFHDNYHRPLRITEVKTGEFERLS